MAPMEAGRDKFTDQVGLTSEDDIPALLRNGLCGRGGLRAGKALRGRVWRRRAAFPPPRPRTCVPAAEAGGDGHGVDAVQDGRGRAASCHRGSWGLGRRFSWRMLLDGQRRRWRTALLVEIVMLFMRRRRPGLPGIIAGGRRRSPPRAAATNAADNAALALQDLRTGRAADGRLVCADGGGTGVGSAPRDGLLGSSRSALAGWRRRGFRPRGGAIVVGPRGLTRGSRFLVFCGRDPAGRPTIPDVAAGVPREKP